MEYQKITHFLGNITPDKLPKFITKNGLRFTMNQMEHTMLIKMLD